MKELTDWTGLNEQLPKQLLRNLQETQKPEKGYDKMKLEEHGNPRGGDLEMN